MPTVTEQKRRTPRHALARHVGFVAAQLVLLGGAVAWAGFRIADHRAERALPPLRNEPLVVAPRYDEPAVISDAQLQRVLRRLAPRRHPSEPKVNHLDHGLRFWGAAARFDDPEALSGEELRQLLVDHNRFAAMFGNDTPPLLIDTPLGVAVRTQQGTATASHHDHTLAALAETGTPLDFPLRTATAETTVRAMLEYSLRTFDLNQIEYEWSALAYALYLPPARQWYTAGGQQMTFDRLARRIMRQDLPQGVCVAHHRLHALVMLLRIHEQVPILAAETIAEIEAFLLDATARLVATQHADGYWDLDWPLAASATATEPTTIGDRRADQILATGHPLEWWALAPSSVLPPRDVIGRAAQWLVRTIDSLSDDEIEQYYTYLSHAGRALTLWRGREPYEVDLTVSGTPR